MRIFLLFVLLCFACDMTDAPPEEGYFSSNGSDLYYRINGSGEAVVVVHGGPVLDHSYLLPWMDELAADYRMIYYDQRACGKSSIEADTSSMRMDAFVDDIENLRKHTGVDKIHLLGHSWGGLLAMKYALRYPQNLASLILSSSIAPSTGEWQQEQLAVAERETPEDSIQRANILASGEIQTNPSAAIEKLMRLSFKMQFYDVSNLEKLNLDIPSDFMTRSALFSSLGQDLTNFDLYPGLTECNVPTLILFGSEEPGGRISGEHMNNTMPDSRLVFISSSGHFPFIENQSEYFRAINEFLSDHSY